MKPSDFGPLSLNSSSNLSPQNLSKTVSFSPNVEVFSEKSSFVPPDLGPSLPGHSFTQPVNSFRRSLQPLGGLADIPEYEPIQPLPGNLPPLTGITPLEGLPPLTGIAPLDVLTPIAPIAGVPRQRSHRRGKKRKMGKSCQ